MSRVGIGRNTPPAKEQLRAELLAGRAARSVEARRRASQALCDRVLTLPEMQAAATVACYASRQEEPGTEPLLDALTARGCRTLLPLQRRDLDLGWAAYQPGALAPGRFGISEPTGEPLAVDVLHEASVVICPGLAADQDGHRLGRGGGSYDRALSRLSNGPRPAPLRIVLLYDDEVLATVPADAHDEPIHAIVTPRRTLWTRWPRGD